MKDYTENIPEWMQLLFDDIREEAFHELQEESKAFRYFNELSAKIQSSSKVSSLLLEHATMKEGHNFSKEELQGAADLIECEARKEDLITQRIYWKAWRDCVRSLRMAG